MTRLMIYLMVIIGILMGTVGVQAQDQTEFDITLPGIDVVIVMENTTRIAQSDPNNLRFNSVDFVAKLLADNALLYRSGAVNRLSLITYSSLGASIQRNNLPFGGFSSPLTDANIRTYNEQLANLGDLRTIAPQGSAETRGFQENVPALLRELIPQNSERRTLVLVVSAGIPQSANPETDMPLFLNNIRNFTRNSTLDFFFLNNLPIAGAIDFNMSSTVNPAARVWTVLQNNRPAGLEGNAYILTDDTPNPAQSVTRLPSFFFNSIAPHLGSEALELDASNAQHTITIPPFVSAMTVVSFSEGVLNITAPSGTSLTAREIESRIRDGAIQTFIAPVAGEYVLNNALNARVFLRMGEATLDTPTSAPQLVRQNLVYTIRDAFNEVFSYVNVGQLPAIQANVYQTPGETWAIAMISNNDGAYTANFAPPYAGSYTLDVTYTLPLTTSNTALNRNLLLGQNTPKTTVEATALTLDIAENLLGFELFQPKTVAVTVNDADTKVLEGNPEIRMEAVSGMSTLAQTALPLGTTYLVEYPDVSFETLTPTPASLTVSLWAFLPANTDGKVEYPIVSNMQFPIAVSAPTMTITPSDDNVILRGIQFDATATNLTSAILTDFNARLCLTIFRPDISSATVDFSALTTNEFIPYINGDYTYVATIHDSTCAGEEISKVGEGGFGVDPLYIGFLDGDNATTISELQEGGLREYLAYTAQLGLFVRRDGTRYERYTGDLTDTPIITSDNTAVGIGSYTDNAYAVLIQPQIATPNFAFTLTASANDEVSLPIYTGISAQNDGAVSVAVKPTTVTLDAVSASQFNNATFAVNIASTQGEETFDATDVNQAGWDVILSLTHEESNESWQIEPVFGNNQYVATVPIPVAGTYNATVTLKTDKGDVVYPLDATIATGVTLASVGNANTVEEENSYTFTYQWQDSTQAHITTFDNLPPVTFSTTIGNETHQEAAILPINPDNQYVYPLEFGINKEGDYQINVAWTTKAPDGTDFADSAILDPNPLQVGAVSPFSVALDGQKLQTYYTPILPLVSLGLRTERILVANVVLQSDIRTIPLAEAFPNFTEENLIVRFKDGEGVCAPFTDANCRLQADKWDLRLDGGVARLEIRDITDNMPYVIDVALENGVQPIAGYRMRASTSTLPVQLRLNALTFLMPIFYVVAVLVITSIGFLITRIIVTRRDSKTPVLEGFLRFEDRDGKRIEWQENLKARNRNRLDIRRDSRLRVVNVRRLVINTVDGKSDEITVRVWWAPPRKWSTFILRALPLDQLRARVKRQLSQDKPESLFAGSTYVVYSHTEKQITTSAPVVTPTRKPFSQATDTSMQTASMPTANMPIPTSGLKRPAQYVPPTPVQTPPVQTPPAQTSPVQTPPPVVEQSPIVEETKTMPPPPSVTPPVTPTEPDSKPLPPPRRKFDDDDDDNPFGN